MSSTEAHMVLIWALSRHANEAIIASSRTAGLESTAVLGGVPPPMLLKSSCAPYSWLSVRTQAWTQSLSAVLQNVPTADRAGRIPREPTKPLLHGLPSYLPPPHRCHPSEPDLRSFPWDFSVVFPLIVVPPPTQGLPTLLMSAL